MRLLVLVYAVYFAGIVVGLTAVLAQMLFGKKGFKYRNVAWLLLVWPLALFSRQGRTLLRTLFNDV